MMMMIILTLSLSGLASCAQLHVYEAVPGLAASPFYSMRVRLASDAEWTSAFSLVTQCTTGTLCDQSPGAGIWQHLTNWSNSYVNFEMEDRVEVQIEITKLWGEPITAAEVHPAASAIKCQVREGKAFVTINKPSLFAVDINGQMDNQNTGKIPNNRTQDRGYYDGPPIHTLTIFANPFLDNKPSLEDEGVYPVAPGERPPEKGSWNTLYFMPGIHDIGHSFTVWQNKTYYIPGDAIIYGTMNNNIFEDAQNVTIFGHGTISGDRLTHPTFSNLPEDEHWRYRPIHIEGAKSGNVIGITIANSASHSLMLRGKHNYEEITHIQWVKIFTWRTNGDGINPFGNCLIEDSFIRTQDDSTYVNGRGIRRVVYWQDSNGSTFVLSSVGGDSFNGLGPLIVEDCTVIYSRAHWDHWAGGALFNMRGQGGGEGGYTLTFRNIVVEDPWPTKQHFQILMQGDNPWMNNPEKKRDPGDIWGITFENISLRARSVMGDKEPETLWGMEDGLIRGLVFRNVTLGGERIEGVEFFNRNEFVFN